MLTQTDLLKLETVSNGQVLCHVATKSTVDSTKLETVYRGQLLWVVGPEGSAGPPVYDATRMFAIF